MRMKIENGIITTRPKLKKRFKENSFQDLNDEDFLEEAIAVSIFESYPKFDLNYLRSLAMQYKGRHDELYKLLELQNYDEDHKICKFSLLRRNLEIYIMELRRAGEPA